MNWIPVHIDSQQNPRLDSSECFSLKTSIIAGTSLARANDCHEFHDCYWHALKIQLKGLSSNLF